MIWTPEYVEWGLLVNLKRKPGGVVVMIEDVSTHTGKAPKCAGEHQHMFLYASFDSRPQPLPAFLSSEFCKDSHDTFKGDVHDPFAYACGP